jgi:hypothetical protein
VIIKRQAGADSQSKITEVETAKPFLFTSRREDSNPQSCWGSSDSIWVFGEQKK